MYLEKESAEPLNSKVDNKNDGDNPFQDS
jgi:hypothetical protein